MAGLGARPGRRLTGDFSRPTVCVNIGSVRKRVGKKLLVASLGVGAVSYVACIGGVANLMAIPQDGGSDAAGDKAADTQSDSASDAFSPLDLVANIVAPR